MSQEYTDFVINSFGPKATPRSRRIIGSLIQHIHDFTRENYITVDEWMYGVEFINKIGQMSDSTRNEGILVSDVLGLEALVDTQTHAVAERHGSSTAATSSAILGPFYRENSPVYKNGESIIIKEVGGVKAYVSGKITNTQGEALAGAMVEVWHCAPNGLYEQQDPEQPDFNLRGTFYTDKDGFYSFVCLEPTAYPIPYDGPAGGLLQFMDRHPMRPSHIHWRVTHPSYHSLITQIYNREDPYTEDDSVFAVKEDCVVDFIKADGKIAEEHQVEKELRFSVALELEEFVQQDRKKIYAQQKALEDHLHEKSRLNSTTK
ncbi:hypothetical protein BABINDRAFT_9732 [Babjeviella inositovora NRRL Y-12698]|uniref:Intradiol ring-cleavage dioxygenases domain-containing protein n=1 Tax=Babjeviella inositovora NRRL Y-12698 TaxID=984486 RepID=A0A1E3QKB9_9ASCO|nr:uncharacterized protein BABINDRAFT_9732 [Babjeviella inositovora NRRL Y-12698]ODQ78133.1 hypothetical protein BABINDRAFT_9732 [Babjeviella inositovora NRRL Y-12698]